MLQYRMIEGMWNIFLFWNFSYQLSTIFANTYPAVLGHPWAMSNLHTRLCCSATVAASPATTFFASIEYIRALVVPLHSSPKFWDSFGQCKTSSLINVKTFFKICFIPFILSYNIVHKSYSFIPALHTSSLFFFPQTF